MAFNIEEMKSALTGGGDRPSLWQVRMAIPGIISGDAGAMEKLTMTARAGAIPPAIVGQIKVPYFGDNMKVVGNRQWPNWTLTIINDEDFLVRRVCEQWVHKMVASMKKTTVDPFGANPITYKTDAYVYKYGKEGELLRMYKLIGVFPIEVAQIDLDWGAQDVIAEFGLTLSYDYWVNDEDILAGDGQGVANFA